MTKIFESTRDILLDKCQQSERIKLSQKWDEINAKQITPILKIVEFLALCRANDMEWFYFGGYGVSFDYANATPHHQMKIIIEMKSLLHELKIRKMNDTDTQEIENWINEKCSEFMTKSMMENEKIKPVAIFDKEDDEEHMRFAKLMNWVREHHPQELNTNLKLADFGKQGTGIFSMNAIQQDAVVFSIPKRLFFSIENSLQDKKLGSLFKKLINEGTNPDTILLLYLMHEKVNVNSFWKPYIDILPREDQLPQRFSNYQLMELENTSLANEYLIQRQIEADTYASLFPRLSQEFPTIFPQELFTFELYFWASRIFYSRAFSFKKFPTILIPFADSMNSVIYPNLETRGFSNEETQCFEIKALGTIPAKNQLYITYGDYPNRQLLQYYGFVIPNNPYDYYNFELSIDEEDELLELKQQLLNKYHLESNVYLLQGMKTILSPSLFALLRIIVLQLDDIHHLQNPLEEINPFEKISEQNEEQIISTLKDTLETLYQGYLNTNEEEEEEKSTSEEELDDLEIMLRLYRSGEMHLFERALEELTHLQ